MPFLVNMRSGVAAAGAWINLLRTDVAPITLDVDWSINYVSGAVPVNDGSSLGGWPTSGAAAWVDDENAATSGHRVPSAPTWVQVLITGPANTSFTVDCYSNGPSGRFVEWRLNGGASQTLDEGTANAVATFSGSTDSNGEALLEYREGAGSSGTGYANALQITPGAAAAVPSFTLDDSDAQPGDTITVTVSDWGETDPTQAVITDSEGNQLTRALTKVTATTFTFTMPTLPTAGNTGSGLVFGSGYTIEVS